MNSTVCLLKDPRLSTAPTGHYWGHLQIILAVTVFIKIRQWCFDEEGTKAKTNSNTMESNHDIHNRSRNRQNQGGGGRSKRGNKTRNRASPVDDEQLTVSLREVCSSRNLIESPSGMRKRRYVMGELDFMLRSWCSYLSSDPSCAPPSLLSFGSYRLGVHTPDADVDCLVLAPPHVTRDDFFESWVDVLNEDERITELHPVRGCVHMMCISYTTIESDLLLHLLTTDQCFIQCLHSSDKVSNGGSQNRSHLCSNQQFSMVEGSCDKNSAKRGAIFRP